MTYTPKNKKELPESQESQELHMHLNNYEFNNKPHWFIVLVAIFTLLGLSLVNYNLYEIRQSEDTISAKITTLQTLQK